MKQEKSNEEIASVRIKGSEKGIEMFKKIFENDEKCQIVSESNLLNCKLEERKRKFMDLKLFDISEED